MSVSITSPTPDASTTAKGKIQLASGLGGSGTTAAAPKLLVQPFFDHVESGCVWTADAAGSTLLASMTSGVVWIGGSRLTVAAVTSRAFTASRDVYADFTDSGSGTATITYTDNTTNAASPALTGLRNAIVVTGATNIAAAASINQGQSNRLLPIASSIPYAVTDSLGNLICPRDSSRRILGYREVTSTQNTSSASFVDVTGANLVVNIPAGRNVRVTGYVPAGFNSTSTAQAPDLSVNDVTSTVNVIEAVGRSANANGETNVTAARLYTPPASGSRNFKLQMKTSAGTTSTNGGASTPVTITVELM